MKFVIIFFAHIYFASTQITPVYKTLHPCTRPCVKGRSMQCVYDFKLEDYITLSRACFDCPFNQSDCSRPGCVAADGIERAVLVVNRQLPGPDIQVCQGDEVIVNVRNEIRGQEATIHWHGIHQRHTQYMDGVPMVTQCGILFGTSFQYKFKAEPSGTHFWHSHSPHQRSDGVFGALVVREPLDSDVQAHLYDVDHPHHAITVMDWMDRLSLSHFAGHHHSDGDNKPESMLVNGKGWHIEFEKEDQIYKTPLEEFIVRKGTTYRFRLISNGVLNCPIEFSIDSHNITIISTDGSPVQPQQVESVIIYGGERFDFILKADKPEDVYWIRFVGYIDCGARHNSARQMAVLRYAGVGTSYPNSSTEYQDMAREGLQLNPVNVGPEDEDTLTITELTSLLPDDVTSRATPDVKIYLPYDFNAIDNLHFYDPLHYPVFAVERGGRIYTPQMNGISMVQPRAPLTSQYQDNPADIFCNHTNIHNCKRHFCECVHMLSFPLNSLVELILIDNGFTYDSTHPFHLHGYRFRVVAFEKIGKNVTLEEVKRLDELGQIRRKLKGAVAKDTVAVPDGGFTIVRFYADNPGPWMFHCHLEWHQEIGMGLIIRVGEQADLPPVPRDFPKCGDWSEPQRQTIVVTHSVEHGHPERSGSNKNSSVHVYNITWIILLYYLWV